MEKTIETEKPIETEKMTEYEENALAQLKELNQKLKDSGVMEIKSVEEFESKIEDLGIFDDIRFVMEDETEGETLYDYDYKNICGTFYFNTKIGSYLGSCVDYWEGNEVVYSDIDLLLV